MKIKTMGLELRTIGTIDSLYEDVDSILVANHIKPGSGDIDNNIVSDAIGHALTRMLKEDHWIDICNIKECAKLSNIVIPKERLSIYSLSHCTFWSQMTEDYRTKLIAMILDDFRSVFLP